LAPTFTDLAGNTISYTFPLVDKTGIYINFPIPKVNSSSSISMPSNDTYLFGENLDFEVTFSSAILVTGTPYIDIFLNSGSGKAYFVNSPSPTKALFRYRPNYGDEDLTDGIKLGTIIHQGTGSIKSGDNLVSAELTLPTIDTSGIKVNSPPIPRTIFSYAALPGLYKSGQIIDIALMFNRPITVNTSGGTPRIPIYVGKDTVYARYDSLSGTQTAIFRYTVGTTEYDLDGITLSSVIDLHGGSITDTSSGSEALLTYVTPNTNGINVDGARPAIFSVQSPASGTYGPTKSLDFVVIFNEVVKVTGTPKIQLTIGSSTVDATYISGTNSNSLLFRYPIQSDDEDTDGIQVGNITGGLIQDSYDNTVSYPLTLSVDSSGIKVDGISPTVSSVVTSPASGNLTTGSQIDIIVTYSEKVVVEGAPYININLGGLIKKASFYSIDATGKILRFKYIIEEGIEDLDGIITSNQVLVQPNLDHIKDPYQNIASLSFFPFLPAPSFLMAPSIKIDSKAPIISSVTESLGGNYNAGDTLDFYVNWSEPVVITGAPTLTLNIDGQTFPLTHSVVNSTQSKFSYTITASTPNSNYIYLSTKINLNSGTIKDDNGLSLDAIINFTPPSLADVIIDTVQPKIEIINSPSLSKTYYKNEFAYINVTFSESLTLTSPSSIKLNLTVGSSSVTADYDSTLSTPLVMVFKYTVAAGQVDNDGIVVNSITLNSGTIEDKAGNTAILTFSPKLLSEIKVNGNSGVILSITPPEDKTYETAEYLDFYVKFDRNVFVTNKPCLKLTIDGGVFRYACYENGSGTDTLLFRYEVAFNESAINGVTLTSPIVLNQLSPLATIKDSIAEDLTLTFVPSPKNYPNLIIDSVPIANKAKVSTNSTYYKQQSNGYIEYNLTYENNVTVTNTPRIRLKIGSTTAYANYSSGSGTSVIKFRYNYTTTAPIDLDGITVYSPVEANIYGTMTSSGTNVINYPLVINEKDYLYPSGIVARYNFQPANVTLTPCGAEMCIDNSAGISIKDISGQGNNISAYSGTGPVIKTGFGTNLTEYAQFDNNSRIEIPEILNPRTIVLVLRNPSDVELSTPGKYHVLMSIPNVEDFITMRSSGDFDGINDVMISFPISMRKNNGSLLSDTNDDMILTNISGASVWSGDTNNILTFQIGNGLELAGTIFGGDSFNGQIAEILIFSLIPSTTVQSQLRTELNSIHGVY